MTIRYERMGEGEREEIERLMNESDLNPGMLRPEEVTVVKDGDTIIGGGRVSDRDGAYELGGFWIDQEHRGRRDDNGKLLAKGLLDRMLELSPNEDIWIVTGPRRAKVYQRILDNCNPVNVEDAPPSIQEDYHTARERYNGDMVVLKLNKR